MHILPSVVTLLVAAQFFISYCIASDSDGNSDQRRCLQESFLAEAPSGYFQYVDEYSHPLSDNPSSQDQENSIFVCSCEDRCCEKPERCPSCEQESRPERKINRRSPFKSPPLIKSPRRGRSKSSCEKKVGSPPKNKPDERGDKREKPRSPRKKRNLSDLFLRSHRNKAKIEPKSEDSIEDSAPVQDERSDKSLKSHPDPITLENDEKNFSAEESSKTNDRDVDWQYPTNREKELAKPKQTYKQRRAITPKTAPSAYQKNQYKLVGKKPKPRYFSRPSIQKESTTNHQIIKPAPSQRKLQRKNSKRSPSIQPSKEKRGRNESLDLPKPRYRKRFLIETPLQEKGSKEESCRVSTKRERILAKTKQSYKPRERPFTPQSIRKKWVSSSKTKSSRSKGKKPEKTGFLN